MFLVTPQTDEQTDDRYPQTPFMLQLQLYHNVILDSLRCIITRWTSFDCFWLVCFVSMEDNNDDNNEQKYVLHQYNWRWV